MERGGRGGATVSARDTITEHGRSVIAGKSARVNLSCFRSPPRPGRPPARRARRLRASTDARHRFRARPGADVDRQLSSPSLLSPESPSKPCPIAYCLRKPIMSNPTPRREEVQAPNSGFERAQRRANASHDQQQRGVGEQAARSRLWTARVQASFCHSAPPPPGARPIRAGDADIVYARRCLARGSVRFVLVPG
jgi:hypothetical protein